MKSIKEYKSEEYKSEEYKSEEWYQLYFNLLSCTFRLLYSYTLHSSLLLGVL